MYHYTTAFYGFTFLCDRFLDSDCDRDRERERERLRRVVVLIKSSGLFLRTLAMRRRVKSGASASMGDR
jgi:hypothetical protein